MSRLYTGILSFLLILPSYNLAAQNAPLLFAGEFWVELDPHIKAEEVYPLPEEEAHRRILEEARYVFSGMIYGFSFVYTPLDIAREVEEIFELVSTAQIPWGDPALEVVETRRNGNLFIALIRYTPSEHQLRWIRMTQSNVYHNATARGNADLYKGVAEKYTSIEEAAKEAIRAHLRPRIYNKPKEIRGKVTFTDVPYIIIDAGEYVAQVSVRIDIDEIIPYRLY